MSGRSEDRMNKPTWVLACVFLFGLALGLGACDAAGASHVVLIDSSVSAASDSVRRVILDPVN